MKLNQEDLKTIASIVMSRERKERRSFYKDLYDLYEGSSKRIISDKLRKEFSDPSAILELEGRLVSINLTKKVVNKLAGVYIENPVRSVSDGNESDMNLLEEYEDLGINKIQKQENRNMVLFKKNLKEISLKKDGTPKFKNYPAHTYEVLAYKSIDLSEVTVVVKIIKESGDDASVILHVFSDESFYIIDGKGDRKDLEMMQRGLDGVNYIGSLPFVYNTEATIGLDPVVDDDLYSMAVCIPIVLTDLLFACKYQCWSLIYTINVTGDIKMNPSSVIPLNQGKGEEKPEIGTIKPEVSINEVIGMVQSILSLFLSSRGLTAGTVNISNAQDAASGISKMIDSADNIENRADQQDYMMQSENDLWKTLSRDMIPFWRKSSKLAPVYNYEFSPNFIVNVSFKSPKTLLSESDQVDISIKKIDNNLSTYRIELRNLNPDMSDDDISNLIEEIKQDAELKAIFAKAKNGIQSDVQNKSSQAL